MKDQDCLWLSDSCDEPIQAVTTTVLLFLPHVFLNTSKLREEEVKVAVRGLLCLCSRRRLLDLDPTSSSSLHASCAPVAFGNRSCYNRFSAVFYSLGFAVVTEVAHVIPSFFQNQCLAVSSWRLTMFLGEHWFVYWGQTMRYFIFRSGSCGSWSSVLKKVSMNCSTKFPTSQ